MNIFQYAASEEAMFERILEDNGFGYKRITTFYSDLSIAECYGERSVKETFNDVCKNWIGDYKYFTEFVMCLNYKSWEMYSKGKEGLSKLYAELYYLGKDKFYNYYGESGKNDKIALDYYFNTMD